MTQPVLPDSDNESKPSPYWYLEYWPALVLGILLSMGVLAVGVPPSLSFLMWMPPAVAALLVLASVVFAPREGKHKETPWERREREAAERKERLGQAVESERIDTAEMVIASEEKAEEAPAAAAEPVVAGDVDILILWGSETGTAQGLAEMTQNRLIEAGKSAKAASMANVKFEQLAGFSKVLIVTSTWGDGEPPSNGIDLWEAFQKKKTDLSPVSFSVLALGDTSYPLFCQCGKDFDTGFEKMGAKRIAPRVDCDLDYEANYEKWYGSVVKGLG